LRRIGAFIAIAAMLFSLSTTAAASAASLTATSVSLSQIPDISYSDRQVTVQGILKAWDQAANAWQPLPGKTVDISPYGRSNAETIELGQETSVPTAPSP
jgi:hypothetical protein